MCATMMCVYYFLLTVDVSSVNVCVRVVVDEWVNVQVYVQKDE